MAGNKAISLFEIIVIRHNKLIRTYLIASYCFIPEIPRIDFFY